MGNLFGWRVVILNRVVSEAMLQNGHVIRGYLNFARRDANDVSIFEKKIILGKDPFQLFLR